MPSCGAVGFLRFAFRTLAQFDEFPVARNERLARWFVDWHGLVLAVLALWLDPTRWHDDRDVEEQAAVARVDQCVRSVMSSDKMAAVGGQAK